MLLRSMLIACGWLLAAPAPDAPQETFATGLLAYDAGRFDEAAAAFAKLAANGADSGWVLYNWGNSALKAGRPGEAIAAYRRSLVDLPRSSDVRANLGFARGHIQDAIDPPGVSPMVRGLFFWHFMVSRHEAVWLGATFLGLFWLLRIPALWHRQRRVFARLSHLCGVGALAMGLSLAVHAGFGPRVGVILAEEVDLHTLNTPLAPVRFRLHAGAEAWVKKSLDGWLLIELSDGKQGWAPQQTVAQLAF